MDREAIVRMSVDNARMLRGTSQAMGELSRLQRHARQAGQEMERYGYRARSGLASIQQPLVAVNNHYRQQISLLGSLTQRVMGLVGPYRSLLATLGGLAFGAGKLNAQFQQGMSLNRQYEMNSLQLSMIIKKEGQAYAEAQKEAQKYIQYAKDWAKKTPFEERHAIMAFSTLAPQVKGDFGKLKELLDIAGLLAAKNPAQGFDGAVFAISEALAGDYISLQERFNVSRSVVNKLKKQGLEGSALLQAALKESKITMELLNAQAETESGLQAAISDYYNIINQKLTQGAFEERKAHLRRLRDRLAKSTEDNSATMKLVELAGQGFKALSAAYYRVLEAPGMLMSAASSYATELLSTSEAKAALETLKADASGLLSKLGEWWSTSLPKARAELAAFAQTLQGPAKQGLTALQQGFLMVREAAEAVIAPIRGAVSYLSEKTGLSPSTLLLIAGGVVTLAMAFRFLGGTLMLPFRLLSGITALASKGGGRGGGGLASVAGLANYAAPAALAYANYARGQAAPASIQALERMAGRAGTRDVLSRSAELGRKAAETLDRSVSAFLSGIYKLGKGAAFLLGALYPVFAVVRDIFGGPLMREAAKVVGNLLGLLGKLAQDTAPYLAASLKLASGAFYILYKVVEPILVPVLKLTNAVLEFLQSGNPLAVFLRNGVGLVLGMVGAVGLLTMGLRGLLNVGQQIGRNFAEWFPRSIGLLPSEQMMPVRGPDGRIMMQPVPRQMSSLQRLWASFWRGPVDEFGQPMRKGQEGAGGAFVRGSTWFARWFGDRANPEAAERRRKLWEERQRKAAEAAAARAEAQWLATPFGRLSLHIDNLTAAVIRLTAALNRGEIEQLNSTIRRLEGKIQRSGFAGPRDVEALRQALQQRAILTGTSTIRTPMGPIPMGGRGAASPIDPVQRENTRAVVGDVVAGLMMGQGLMGALFWALQGLFAGLFTSLGTAMLEWMGKGLRPLAQRVTTFITQRVAKGAGGEGGLGGFVKDVISGTLVEAIAGRIGGMGGLRERLGRALGRARTFMAGAPSGLLGKASYLWGHFLNHPIGQRVVTGALTGWNLLSGGAMAARGFLATRGPGLLAAAGGWLRGLLGSGSAAAGVASNAAGGLFRGILPALGRFLPVLGRFLPMLAGGPAALIVGIIATVVGLLFQFGPALWRAASGWFASRKEEGEKRAAQAAAKGTAVVGAGMTGGGGSGFVWWNPRTWFGGGSKPQSPKPTEPAAPTTPVTVNPKLFGNAGLNLLAYAIISKESSGKYQAINKDTQALGLGQVMPENLWGWDWAAGMGKRYGTNKAGYYRPANWKKLTGQPGVGWDYEALGRDITPEEFLANPALQVQIQMHQLKKRWEELSKMGLSDEEKVKRIAASWYGSPNMMWVPSSKLPTTPQPGGYPSLKEYADNVWQRVSQMPEAQRKQAMSGGWLQQFAAMGLAGPPIPKPAPAPSTPAPQAQAPKAVSIQLGDINLTVTGTDLGKVEKMIAEAQARQRRELLEQLKKELKLRN